MQTHIQTDKQWSRDEWVARFAVRLWRLSKAIGPDRQVGAARQAYQTLQGMDPLDAAQLFFQRGSKARHS